MSLPVTRIEADDLHPDGAFWQLPEHEQVALLYKLFYDSEPEVEEAFRSFLALYPDVRRRIKALLQEVQYRPLEEA